MQDGESFTAPTEVELPGRPIHVAAALEYQFCTLEDNRLMIWVPGANEP